MKRLLLVLHERMDPQDAAVHIREIADALEKGVLAGSWNEVDWEASS